MYSFAAVQTDRAMLFPAIVDGIDYDARYSCG